jgi:hypothetical protein
MGDLAPLTKYGDRLNTERRLMNQVLSRPAIEKWHPVVMKEVHSLLKQVLDNPEEYLLHLRRYAHRKVGFAYLLNQLLAYRMAASLIFSTVYGYHIAEDNDPYVVAAEEFMDVSSYAVTAGWLVDFLPFRQIYIFDILSPNY